jgi:hypothetical protein
MGVPAERTIAFILINLSFSQVIGTASDLKEEGSTYLEKRLCLVQINL